MGKTAYHKIVRDKIPEIIADAGKRAEIETVSREEAISGLEDKLREEMNEYLESKDAEELADIAEVICGIVYHRYGMTPEEFDAIRQKKRNERGVLSEGKKPRTYREKAHRKYNSFSKNRKKTVKLIRKRSNNSWAI